ncbi:MAG: MSHA biogenesis protein MshK [Pseudomonadota bacterium]
MAARMMLCAAIALLTSPGVWADLPDPTALPAAPAAEGGASPGISLTAIKRRGTQRLAVIGGQEVAVGGRYQGARVVRITESEVVLRRGADVTVLELYPHVEKRLRGK